METLTSKRIEIHQIEGLDPHQRVFNRNIDLLRTEGRYVFFFSYEGKTFSSESRPTIKESLRDLVGHLQKLGFSRLRSRINFRGKRYLAESEPWINYNDAAT